MVKNARIQSFTLLAIAVILTLFIFFSETGRAFTQFPFRFGLDISGGTQLIYDADVSEVPPQEQEESLAALRDVIERRVNLFGVSEPRVQIERGGVAGGEERLLVELPGVTDIEEAVSIIGETPTLEFKLMDQDAAAQSALEGLNVETEEGETVSADESEPQNSTEEEPFVRTGLTGRYLTDASMQFDQTSGEPIIALNFNAEGTDLFAEITREHTGETLAIFLDGRMISAPTIQTEIVTGDAIITGDFTPEEARELARNLSYGALPIPIELVTTNSVGPTLGGLVLSSGVSAALIGLSLIALFMVVWYRVPGILAVFALATYILLMLFFFKIIPVTITGAGIAAFILSIGMAVDANVLIFERMKEEVNRGLSILEAAETGFARAWPSIRDANLSSLITAIVLFWLGTSAVQGFALVFGLGILLSMGSAVFVTRTLLLALGEGNALTRKRILFRPGLSRNA